MKKNKILYIAFLLFLIAEFVLNNVYGFGNGFDKNFYNEIKNNSSVDTNVENVIVKVYGTISVIIKVIALGGVVYAGVKYMMAGAGDKGAIKQNLIYIVMGTIFVYGADAIIRFVIKSGTEII